MKKLFKNKLSIAITAILLLGGITYVANKVDAAGFNTFAGGTYTLQTSVGSADTTIRLSSFKDPHNNYPVTMAYMNTDIVYGTLDPQSTRAEIISFTGITQNTDGTAILTGVTRGLLGSYPYTASSTLRKTHPGQSIFIVSDAPQVFNEYPARRSTSTISAVWTFASTSIPQLDAATTSTGNQFITADGVGLTLSSYLLKSTTTLQTVTGPVTFSGAIINSNTTSLATTTIGTTTVNGSSTFFGRVYIPTAPTIGSEAVNKTYVDAQVVAGAPNALPTTTGIVRIATSTLYARGFASSTLYYVLSSAISSSTASTSAVIVSTKEATGKIDPSFLNGTNESYVWNATTTFASSSMVLNGSGAQLFKYGGTGVDNALTISAGTTTIDLGSASYVEKNYTTISITGTGHLAFINPAANGTTINLRSQGNVTITCSVAPCIEVSGLGGIGGTAQSNTGANLASVSGQGYLNTGGPFVQGQSVNIAGQKGSNTGGFSWTYFAVNGSTNYGISILATVLPALNQYDMPIPAGGGSGAVFNGGGGSTGGDGGRGGGALNLEINGSLNFTGSIWGKGFTGGTGTVQGGPGAGGSIKVAFSTSTAISGTIDVTGPSSNNGQSLIIQNTSK